MSTPTLLVIDDEPAVRRLIARYGERAGFQTVTANGPAGLQTLSERRVDLVIADHQASGLNGLDVLRRVRDLAPGCEAVLMTGFATHDSAVEAVTHGAMDYLDKPLDTARLESLLEAVRSEIRRQRSVFEMEGELARRLEFCGMIGRGAAMQDLFARLRRLAPHARTVLITGETGTGKALAARALHDLGPRRQCRFITIKCPDAVETMFEATGGTLFLDEVGELPLALQAVLLRVIEAGHVHVVAATSRDLRAGVAAGRFRGDLLCRLDGVEVQLPPLRERREDVPYLTAAFMRVFAARAKRVAGGITPGAERLLQSAFWAGNVRELRNVVERACMLCDGGPISERELSLALPRDWRTPRDHGLPGAPDEVTPHPPESAAAPLPTLSRLERDHVLRALERARGNKKAAAEMLGVSRRAFYRRLERLSLGDTIARRPGPAEPPGPAASAESSSEVAHA